MIASHSRLQYFVWSLLAAVWLIFAWRTHAMDGLPDPDAAHEVARQVIAVDGEKGEAINEHILFLARVRGKSELEFYLDSIEALKKLKTDDSLPALEALLSREDFLDGSLGVNHTRVILARVRAAATPLWYDLRWREATLEEKIQTALYAVRPNPPITPSQKIGVQRILALGDVAREPLYEILKDPDLSFTSSPAGVGAVSQCAKLLTHETFRPTDEEIRNILANAGEFGRGVILYLAEDRRHEAMLDAFSRWCSEHKGEPEKIGLMAWKMRYFADDADPWRRLIARVLVDVGRMAQVRSSSGESKNSWRNLLLTLHSAMEGLSGVPSVRHYLTQYLKSREDGNLSEISNSDPMEMADKFAKMALERSSAD